MDHNTIYLGLACLFGFTMAWGIGANDVSNAMGTSVGSKAITIRQAIVIAAIFEFLGAFLAGGEVTNTIKREIIDTSVLIDTPEILIHGMIAALFAAGTWLTIASLFGWPVSTTHTIVGAIIGFGVVQLGLEQVQWERVISIIFGWVASPFLGAAIAFSIFRTAQKFIFSKFDPLTAAKKVVPVYIFLTSIIIYLITGSKLGNIGIHLDWYENIICSCILSTITAIIGKIFIKRIKYDSKLSKKSAFANVEKIFAVLMLFTACAMAFAHGSNDVANAIGPLAAIVTAIHSPSELANTSGVQPWVLFFGATGIVVGLATYGHKVIATVGDKITELTPSRGFSATLAAASTVVLASSTGLPISTTHTLIGGILGVGLARGMPALNLNVIKSIIASWIITLPAGALFSILFYKVLQSIFT